MALVCFLQSSSTGQVMAQAYTPGLKVAGRVVQRARRVLPIAGDVVVRLGQRVGAQEVVARTELPGDITPVNLANLLNVSAGDVPACMLKHEGERVEAGEVLARTKGMFGWFKTEATAPVAGTLETVSSVTGQVMIRGKPSPVEVFAFLAGEVVEVLPGSGVVIEAEVAYIQGIFGIGGEAYGMLRATCGQPSQVLDESLLHEGMRGGVVIGGGRVTAGAIRRAVQLGVAAIVTGGIDDQDLRDFLGYDLGVAITGSEQVGLTLIITEGFGDIAMADRTFQLLHSHLGKEVSVTGATQIRAGVMRPEVIIPLSVEERVSAVSSTGTVAGELAKGAAVRMIRDPYFGLIGSVHELPPETRVLASGSKARVLTVKLETGETIVVPRANVELIEG